ncbi:MAG: efflux RND transporter periplasmic adaptor subunit [bacterium]
MRSKEPVISSYYELLEKRSRYYTDGKSSGIIREWNEFFSTVRTGFFVVVAFVVGIVKKSFAWGKEKVSGVISRVSGLKDGQPPYEPSKLPHKKTNRLKKRIFISLGILLLAFLGWYFFIPKGTTTRQTFAKATEKSLTNSVTLTGEVTSGNQKMMKFDASGKISSVGVKIGDKVKEGQKLGSIDLTELKSKVLSAKGTLNSAISSRKKKENGLDVKAQDQAIQKAQIALENAQKDLDSTRKAQEVASKQAQADIRAKQLSLATSQNNLEHTERDSAQDSYIAALQKYNAALDLDGVLNSKQNAGSGSNGSSATSTTDYSAVQKAELAYNIALEQQVKDNLARDTKLQSAKSSVLSDSVGMDTFAATQEKSKVDQETALTKSQNAIVSAELELESQQTKMQELLLTQPYDLEALKAQEMQAQASIDLAQMALDNGVLYAPFDGVITQVTLKKGDSYAGNADFIQVTDFSQLQVAVDVSERDVLAIRAGQKAVVYFDTMAGVEFNGKVTLVDPNPKKTQGVVNYTVTVSLPVDPRIRLGMSANIQIITAQTEPAIVVSSRAISKNSKGQDVVKVRRNGNIVDQVVELGITNGTETQILSGLEVGDEVLSTGGTTRQSSS